MTALVAEDLREVAEEVEEVEVEEEVEEAVEEAVAEVVAEVVAEEVVPLLSPLQLLLLLGQFRAVLGLLSGQLTRTHFPGTLVLKQGREQK